MALGGKFAVPSDRPKGDFYALQITIIILLLRSMNTCEKLSKLLICNAYDDTLENSNGLFNRFVFKNQLISRYRHEIFPYKLLTADENDRIMDEFSHIVKNYIQNLIINETALCYGYSYMTDDLFQSICEVDMKSLQIIDLNRTRLTDKSTQNIIDLIVTNPVQWIKLGRTSLSNDSLLQIISNIPDSVILLQIHISGSRDILKDIFPILKNKKLIRVTIDLNEEELELEYLELLIEFAKYSETIVDYDSYRYRTKDEEKYKALFAKQAIMEKMSMEFRKSNTRNKMIMAFKESTIVPDGIEEFLVAEIIHKLKLNAPPEKPREPKIDDYYDPLDDGFDF